MSEEDVQEFPESKQVTAADMAIIAFWCGGAVIEIDHNLCIKVTKYDIALDGDWIVKTSDGYEVMRDDEYQTFLASWGRDTDKFKKVLKLVTLAMLEQVAASTNRSDKDMRLVAEETARKIIDLG